MGLRETKAARTRAQIIEIALDLFMAQGYDDTTMEQIAECAEIGTTTLYRYFPSKDLIILDPFTKTEIISDALLARPADEPLDVAIGNAIIDAFRTLVKDEPRVNDMRTIIDSAPVPRAHLWDFIAQHRDNMSAAIAKRTGEPADSWRVRLTGRMAGVAIEVIGDDWRSSNDERDFVDIAYEAMAALRDSGIVLPNPTPRGPHALSYSAKEENRSDLPSV